MEVKRPSTHGDKLVALLSNRRLPDADRPRVEKTKKRYDAWKNEMLTTVGNRQQVITKLVTSLNKYKREVELYLIFDSENDFLYRQKGQLKLDNTILEEFLPYLFDKRLVPGLERVEGFACGPTASFAGLSFASPFMPLDAGGVYLKLKDQDFSISKFHRITIADEPPSNTRFEKRFLVSHFAAEIKTNLDKTMFQEASQTAAELKRAVPGSRYILLCEFLDMTPITTKLTSIDEVIVLRKAKRLGSNIRSEFSTAAGRKRNRALYERLLNQNLLRQECFERFLWHLNEIFPEKAEDEEDIVLGRGYF